jgi:hypothetical protein
MNTELIIREGHWVGKRYITHPLQFANACEYLKVYWGVSGYSVKTHEGRFNYGYEVPC